MEIENEGLKQVIKTQLNYLLVNRDKISIQEEVLTDCKNCLERELAVLSSLKKENHDTILGLLAVMDLAGIDIAAVSLEDGCSFVGLDVASTTKIEAMFMSLKRVSRVMNAWDDRSDGDLPNPDPINDGSE